MQPKTVKRCLQTHRSPVVSVRGLGHEAEAPAGGPLSHGTQGGEDIVGFQSQVLQPRTLPCTLWGEIMTKCHSSQLCSVAQLPCSIFAPPPPQKKEGRACLMRHQGPSSRDVR